MGFMLGTHHYQCSKFPANTSQKTQDEVVARINPEKATKPKVLEWFDNNPQLSIKLEPSTLRFLIQRSFASSRLA